MPSEWSLVMPLKRLSLAKSRLSAAGGRRPGLALAFAQDTVTAALASSLVREVTVVTDDPVAGERLGALGARIVPDGPRNGLNPALAYGADTVRARLPTASVAALHADLPALRPSELARVLRAARHHPRSFLADTAGTGTTVLAAGPGVPLAPAFGDASRERHRASGAAELELTGVESVRRDVDTEDDLRAALVLGVGPRTAAASAEGLRRSGASRR
ncbi:2-phospho-L-lactate guanylyltransferase [Streptomyces sodiiphilus]|uniref:Phosphoenolpyruvate guanylyltransferase n=1 Tax=Streptomyces sodiiphilus TaxID=226217 RepID=A0ABN2NRF9_9ACTN